MPVDYEFAERLRKLPPYVFAKIDELKKEKEASGIEVINLGIGDPDLPPPERVIKKLQEASLRLENNRYPSYAGKLELRTAIANWYEARFNVILDPKTEVLVLCGSKEGIAHLPQAFINAGDGVLVPNPAYPVYSTATILTGGVPVSLPLREEKDFLPDLEAIDRKALDRAKMLFLNYPSNPTTATADAGFFNRIAEFSRKRELIVCHDNAYSEIYFDNERPVSYLQAKGARDCWGVEFHSLSKTFSMCGFRLGFVVGNKRIIEGLSKVKTNIDSGVYQAVQEAGIVALEQCWKDCDSYRKVYESRRNYFCKELKRLKFDFRVPSATFYVWCRVPLGFSSETFTEFLIKEAGLLVTPGTGFGSGGQGYVRFSLTMAEEKIRIAVQRLEEAMRKR